jgi:N6-L-threonylcarbamoyladenine synthase
MIILAIETSCDETAIAVLKNGKILSNIVSSQVKIHAEWGGVVPSLAKREHLKNLPIVLKKALMEAKLDTEYKILNTIDAIAVTTGPGLEPALWTGINFAQELAKKWKKPIVAINHMEGHIFSVFLKQKPEITFPALALLVSGGHTELVFMKKLLNYKIIGSTLDDAAGEAFDKTAKMLGLPYPGGPEISRMASKFKREIQSAKFEIKLPRPMINSKNYDFSFSGLKTAVLYLLRDMEKKVPNAGDRLKLRPFICKEFQQAVIDVLISKTVRAAKEFKAKTIILAGGVAANEELRRQLGETVKKNIPRCALLVPRYEFTGDNAAMIALAASFRAQKKQFTNPDDLKADGNLKLS